MNDINVFSYALSLLEAKRFSNTAKEICIVFSQCLVYAAFNKILQ